MTSKINIAISKRTLPSGTVLLADAGVLVEGFQDALARIIQQQLGYSVRSRLRKEAIELSALLLVGVGEGSGVLECQTLPESNSTMPSPASVAASELVASIETYNRTRSWPPNLPSTIRNKFGRTVAPVISGSDEPTTVILSVEENGSVRDCYIDSSVEEALQMPEEFSTAEPVVAVGKMYDINMDSRTFKIDTGEGRVEVRVDEDDLDNVDRLRWGRVTVTGFPTDERCRSLENISSLRRAEENEEDGITLPSEMSSVDRKEALVYAKERAEEFRTLSDHWDSYEALPPALSTIDFALNFLRDVATMLAAYDIDLPVPFFVPTLSRGVQFEWEVGSRDLELEIPSANEFRYLKIGSNEEREGSASRWEAMRLIHWVATGEQV